MPIHNEQELLPYSLPSIYTLNPNEVLLVLDRCTDKSKIVIQKIADYYKKREITHLMEINETSPDWNKRSAFLRRYAFKLCKNEIILNTDADLILDKKIKKYLSKLINPTLGLIGFGFFDYPFNIQSFSKTIISKMTPFSGFAGLYAFKKTAWLETEKMESLKKISSSEDTHLRLSIMKKYETMHINTKTLHLRPAESSERSYLRGVMYWDLLRYPLWKMIFYSLATFRTSSLRGYLDQRRKSQT
jgi:hypothetical protein